MTDIFHYFKNYLVNAGLSPQEFKKITKEVQKSNRQNLIIFSLIAFVFLLMMFIVSFFNADVSANKWVYFSSMIVMGLIFSETKFLSVKHPQLLHPSIYIFMCILFSFGIILGTITRPDEQTVTFIALLLTVPLLFTDRPIRMIGLIFIFVFAFVIIAIRIKEDYVLNADIIDCFVFGAISAIVSTYMMRVKCQRYLYELKAIELSENDLLTGLHNRNAYEKIINLYPNVCKKSLSCIYIDVNGLHEINNLRGHKAGDDMLKYVASQLRDQFGINDSYRIGGDEFVVFVIDSDYDSINKALEETIRSIEEQSYHVSVGFDIQQFSEINVDLLIKNAENKMYEAKHQFYINQGSDRRVRN